jgi:hypothetical protein
MKEIQQALSEIHLIRSQVARGTQFRGYGPASIAFTGLLALGVAWAQNEWGGAQKHDLVFNLSVWICAAAVAVAVSGVETIARARRVHYGLAQEMLQSAVEQFFPALVVGVLLTAVLVKIAPNEFWLFPGLWELIFSLGIFASCRFLPRPMFGVGIWYLVAGLCSLLVSSGPKSFLPWTMGIPFGVGQLLVACVLQFCVEGKIEEA